MAMDPDDKSGKMMELLGCVLNELGGRRRGVEGLKFIGSL